ncbi:MAG: glycosyltransferase [Desulfobacterales bacterium]|nr:glycosyltransferase [Desulfobacterales bacterium]
MTAEAAKNDWEYFDKIYCISLKDRIDRQAEAKIQFGKVGLSDKVEFVIVPKHPHNCEEGIYDSHLACLKSAIQAGAGNVVIFEDDILFDRFSPARLKNCIDFLSANPDWNALFFGCLVSSSKRTQNESVLKIKYRCLAHAYALNRRFAETIIKTPWREIPYDDMLSKHSKNFYAIYPSFAFQSNSRTDNNRNVRLDKIRRWCGGLWRIQKINEFYHRHLIAVIATHIILIVIILKWIL